MPNRGRDKRIRGITIEIGGDTTKLQKALQSVNSEIWETQGQLKDVNRLLKLDPGNTELIAQKHRLLGEAVSETKDKLKTLQTAAEQAHDALERGDISQEQYDALQREIIETTQDLKKLETQAAQSGEAVQAIAAKGEKLKAMGDTISGVGEKLLPVTAAIGATGTAAALKFADVDKIMSLTNSTMGNTEEQAKVLQTAMEEAAAQSVYSMTDAANATLNFARAGLTAEQAAAALAPAMNLAAGEGGNLDTVSAGLVGTINGFGDSFENAGHYADVFASACNNSALDIDSLSNSMSIAAPVFKTAGYSVDDAALYMGVMANNGISASEAANALKTGLARLVDPAKSGQAALDRLQWSILDGNGSMKDCITIQRELHDKFSGLSEAEQIAAASAIFGKNQMSKWLALINTAPEDVGKLNQSLTECKGTTDDMAKAMMDGFGGSIEQLKSTADVFMVQIGRLIAEMILPLIRKLTQLLTWLSGLDDGTKKIIITVAAVIAALGPLLIVIGTLMSAIGSIMTWAPIISGAITTFTGTLLPALSGGLSGLFALLVANPIGLVIAGIAALVAAVVYLWNTNEDFRDFVIDCWERVKTAFSALADALSGLLDAMGLDFGTFGELVRTIWDGLCSFLAPLLEGSLWLVVTILENALRLLTEALNTFSALFRGDYEAFWNGIVEFTEDVLNTLTFGAYGWGKDMVSSFMQGLKEKLPQFKETISNLAQSVRSFIHFSEPDEGPLSDFSTYAPDMMRLFAQGITDYTPMVQSAMNRAFVPPELNVSAAGALPEVIPAGLARNQPIQQTVVLQIDRTQFARLVHQLNMEESKRIGVNLAGGGA